MAASSSVVRPTPTWPQVFISFRGKDVRSNFISFLDHALRKANINIFIDEDELLGADLSNLLKRIEKSEVALVIFSKDYTSSDWCLDELAKIKERKDQGRLTVIPIFYKLKPSFVKHLKGEYGDNFRDLKRNHRHQPERTQKREEALVSIPESIGMPLADQSDRTDREFINSMVVEIQRLLEHMAMRGNPEPEANRQGGSMVPFMVLARQLEITHSENPQKWAWSIINEAPNSAAIEIATIIKIHWLKIVGTFKTTCLIPGTKYEAVFVVKLEDDAIGWDQPVSLKLKVVQHDGYENRVDRTANLNGYIGHSWVDILAGVFMAPPKNTPATITFTMYQYETDWKFLSKVIYFYDNPLTKKKKSDWKKKGLVVKGVAIRPTN